jgi:hypothetical protein
LKTARSCRGEESYHSVSQAGPLCSFDSKILAENPPTDIELAKIGDLLNCDLAAFLKKAVGACDGGKAR